MALAALAVAACAWMVAPRPVNITCALIAAAMPALTWIDLDARRLPDLLTATLSMTAAAGLALTAIVTGDLTSLLRAGAGAITATATLFILCLLVSGGPGLGDVKLAPALAATLAWCSWHTLAAWALLAVGTNAVVGIALMLSKRVDRHAAMPFGPAMMAGWFAAFVVAAAPV